MKKSYKEYLIGFIIGVLVASTGVAYASYAILSSSVTFQPNSSSWEVDNVEDALDDLYELAKNGSGSCSIPYDGWSFDYKGQLQVFTAPLDGDYKVELWGAQGGTGNNAEGGLGAYTSGVVNLTEGEILYVYVGQQGNASTASTQYSATGGYNGGGSTSGYQIDRQVYYTYASGGGGATDIRFGGDSLNDRIMVAAGGGGNGTESRFTNTPGAAGGLTGYAGTSTSVYGGGTGGSQTTAGTNAKLSSASYNVPGKFGIGGSNSSAGLNGAGWNGCGGGGGYYGGGAGGAFAAGGGGGSSYISGHTGCVAIANNSTTEPRAVKISGCDTGTSNNECSVHYSNKIFNATVMIDGQGYTWTNTKGSYVGQPQPDNSVVAGHSGNGHARITYLG